MISRLPDGINKSYCPFGIWTLKTCYQFITKIITARGFKLGQLIEDDE